MLIDNQVLTNENFRKVLDVANKDIGGIVRYLAEVKQERKFLDKVEKFLLQTLGAKREGEFEDDYYGWHIIRTLEGGRVTVDMDKIKAEQGDNFEEWFKEHSKKGEDFYKVVITKAGEKPQEEPT